MRQQALRKERTTRPTMRVVKGWRTQNRISPLVNTAWNFAYSSLWNCTQFPKRNWYRQRKKLKNTCGWQNTLKKHFPFSAKGIAYPVLYQQNSSPLCTRCHPYGLTGQTKMVLPVQRPGIWWNQIRKRIVAQLQNELKAMAEVVLEFSEEPTIQNYQYWRNILLTSKRRDC